MTQPSHRLEHVTATAADWGLSQPKELGEDDRKRSLAAVATDLNGRLKQCCRSAETPSGAALEMRRHLTLFARYGLPNPKATRAGPGPDDEGVHVAQTMKRPGLRRRGHEGLILSNTGAMNLVLGNHIGTDISGNLALGNGTRGVLIYSVNGQYYRWDDDGCGNIIANNGTFGVLVAEDSTTSDNSILGNSIHDNQGAGIRLGENIGEPLTSGFPTTRSTSTPVPTGYSITPSWARFHGLSLAPMSLGSSRVCRIRRFGSNFSPTSWIRSKARGRDGEVSRSSTQATSGADGNWPILIRLSTPVPVGEFLTATATDPMGNTSEFSAAKQVVSASDDLTASAILVPTAPGVGGYRDPHNQRPEQRVRHSTHVNTRRPPAGIGRDPGRVRQPRPGNDGGPARPGSSGSRHERRVPDGRDRARVGASGALTAYLNISSLGIDTDPTNNAIVASVAVIAPPTIASVIRCPPETRPDKS